MSILRILFSWRNCTQHCWSKGSTAVCFVSSTEHFSACVYPTVSIKFLLLDKTVPSLQFWMISFYYFKLYVCLCVVCAHKNRCSKRPGELDSPGIAGGTEHLTWFLGIELGTWKSRASSKGWVTSLLQFPFLKESLMFFLHLLCSVSAWT